MPEFIKHVPCLLYYTCTKSELGSTKLLDDYPTNETCTSELYNKQTDTQKRRTIVAGTFSQTARSRSASLRRENNISTENQPSKKNGTIETHSKARVQ